MRNEDWKSMDEKEFDNILQNILDETPPEEIVVSVTPWGTAMNKVLWGLALTTITFNFLLLNYILPTIGLILMLLGFRTLRKENIWFRGCWWVTVIRIVYVFVDLIINTTIWQSKIHASSMDSILVILNVTAMLIQFFCLWRGLCMLKEKSGLPIQTRSAFALLVWYGVVALIALMHLQLFIVIAIIFIVAYICIIRNLYKLSKELDEAGYAIRTVPVRISDRGLVAAMLTVLSIGMACGYIFGGSYSMEWKPDENKVSSQTEKIKEELIDLGFPENVLADLTEEEIKACEGAMRVAVDESEHPFNKGRQVRERLVGGYYDHTVYDVKELHLTGIAVELPDKQWKIFHHFIWTVNPGFYGTEAIQLWPAYRDMEGFKKASEFTGRLLYDEGEQRYAAPYQFLGEESYTSTSVFWGNQINTDVFATFSLPKKGENQRGYFSYAIQEIEAGGLINSWVNYTHQRSWVQFPAMTAMEKRKTSDFSHEGAFYTIQDALQYVPTN